MITIKIESVEMSYDAHMGVNLKISGYSAEIPDGYTGETMRALADAFNAAAPSILSILAALSPQSGGSHFE